jgi:hypothetical protein
VAKEEPVTETPEARIPLKAKLLLFISHLLPSSQKKERKRNSIKTQKRNEHFKTK